MALTLEQRTAQKQSQNTILLMNMIQMTGTELQEYVESIMQDNPVFDMDSIPVHEEAFRAPKRNALDEIRENDQNVYLASKSLALNTLIQLDALKLSPELLRNTRFLAIHLDERAYLPPEELEHVECIIGKEKAQSALEVLQSLSPAGIAAGNLSECLMLQLKRMPQNTELAQKIVLEHLELLSKGHFKQIARLTNSELPLVHAACDLIKSLDPKPGRAYDEEAHTEYVIPDIFMDENGAISLNARQVPNLSLSEYYRRMLKTNTDPEVVAYLSEKFRQAEGLMNTLQRRNVTVLRCVEAIVENQKVFFSSGGQGSIQPLTQSQIAVQTGLSESTVSRVVNGKYIQCSFGTYPLSAFFSVGLRGEIGASSTDVKDRLRLLIANEEKTSPLSDQDIADKLSSEGISISRRTVAKYRQQLNIPGTFVRKQG